MTFVEVVLGLGRVVKGENEPRRLGANKDSNNRREDLD